MRHILPVLTIAFSVVGLAAVFGYSEGSGLFGGIIGVGIYACNAKGGEA